MRRRRDRAVGLVVLLATGTLTACTSASTQTTIRSAEAAGGADILMWLDSARMAREVELDLAMAHGDLDRALADLDLSAGAHVPRVALPVTKEPDHGH
jgi:dihydroxyacetone kinase DhaKLM complex PTS-EIIA-like component DhaM